MVLETKGGERFKQQELNLLAVMDGMLREGDKGAQKTSHVPVLRDGAHRGALTHIWSRSPFIRLTNASDQYHKPQAPTCT